MRKKILERSTIADAKAAVCLLCPRIFGGLCSIPKSKLLISWTPNLPIAKATFQLGSVIPHLETVDKKLPF